MQLTGLEIYGFKSFADKTKFSFDSGITGIVGPNGCGKSNIVDAIRWVLGEQSAKYLRSDKMENVIFNGTDARRKANYAEVSLTFENTKNLLPTEYTTITITRKLYRSGESEYLLNGVQCRLKDITGLFMDTGIASDSYAIIELKMVEEILTNKDNERRRFFEEAAGISKYKLRKKQTLRKLEETDADLTRVEDLLAEIEKNLKSLEKQAKRTQKYIELKAQYKTISTQYAYLKLQVIRDEQNYVEKQALKLEDALAQSQAEIAKREARLAELRKIQIEEEETLSQSQQKLNAHVRQLQEAESQKNVKNERLKYLRQREIALTNQIETEKKQAERTQTEIEIISTQKIQKELELQRQNQLFQDLKSKLQKAQEAQQLRQRNASQHEVEYKEYDNELRRLVREKEIQQVRIKSLDAEMLRAEEDRNVREGDLDEFSAKNTQLQTEISDLKVRLKNLNEQNHQHEQLLKQTEDKIAQLKDALYQSQRSLDAKQHDYNLTKSLVDSLEGFPESVKFLKKNALWMKDAPLLSDIFTAADGYKAAIEQFLEHYLNYYIVENRSEAKQAIELLANANKGRVNFFILDEFLDAAPPILAVENRIGTPVQNLVEVSDKYRPLADYLLQNVFVVEDENQIPKEIPASIVFLQKDGKNIQRKYVHTGGSVGLFEGKRLGRAKNLAGLEKEVMQLRLEVETQKKELQNMQQQIEQLRKIKYQQEIDPLNRSLIEKEKDLQLLATREKEHKDFLLRVGQRTDALRAEWQHLHSSLKEIEPQIQESQVFVNRTLRDLTEAKEELQLAMGESNILTTQYNQAHIQQIQLQNFCQNLQADWDRKTQQTENYEQSVLKMQQENADVKHDIEGLLQLTHKDNKEMLEMNEEKKRMEISTDKLAQKVGETKNFIRQQEENIENERKQREEIQQNRQKTRDQIAEIRLQMTSLKERMAVEFQIEIEDLSATILQTESEIQLNLLEVEPQLHKIRQQVQNFGEINPMALEAFQEMEERYKFIKQQCDDLYAAKKTLLDTIAEIDLTATEKFQETFVQVREHFIQVFRSLFTENDTCDLILSQPERPLESEIDIIARPKGKRPLTITQLSGGEKTLTAVALLFSIYLIKPAPFCIFDEVDAPLDDANIDKFNNIIREFSAGSQFIIVTHNKRTMASTNVMYGITMEDTGVSRMLPVSLEALNLN